MVCYLATKTAKLLKNHNQTVTKIGNSKSFDYKETLIVDWKETENSLYSKSLILNHQTSLFDRQDKPIDVTLVTEKIGHTNT